MEVQDSPGGIKEDHVVNGVIFQIIDEDDEGGTVYGDVTLTENLEIPNGRTLTVGKTATLTILEGLTLNNNGTIQNDGTIYNNGEILDHNEFNGDGAVIGNEVKSDYKLTLEVPQFDAVDEAYSQPAAQTITLKNAGVLTVEISSVEIEVDGFTIDQEEITSIAPDAALPLGTVQPEANLPSGRYTVTVTMNYDCGALGTRSVTAIVEFLVMAEGIPYLDSTGAEQICPKAVYVSDGMTVLKDGWYVVKGDVTVDARIQVQGDVHLILEDEGYLKALSGIAVNKESSLSIYCQSQRSGKLETTNPQEGGAAIGADADSDAGDITINGGNITAIVDHEDGSCIGQGDWNYKAGSVTVNDGYLKLTANVGSLVPLGEVYQINNGIIEFRYYGDSARSNWFEEGDIRNAIIFALVDALYVSFSDGDVYGNVTLASDLEIPEGVYFKVQEDAVLTIPEGVTLTNYGSFTNNGTIHNEGMFYDHYELNDNGEIIGNQPISDYRLVIELAEFPAEVVGHTPTALPIVIRNVGLHPATITEVTHDDDRSFVLTGGEIGELQPGETNEGWTVQPKADLETGDYIDTIIVIYDDERETSVDRYLEVISAAEKTLRETGDGTEENPYRISNIKTLEAFRDYINDSSSGYGEYFLLTKDIDLSPEYGEEKPWWSIAAEYYTSYGFRGTFEGAGNTISGLYLEASDGQDITGGLFGWVEGGTIRNLNVSGTVINPNMAGGIAGCNEKGLLENCTFTGTISDGDVTSRETTCGGIVSENLGTVIHCTFDGSVSGDYSGGIVGSNESGSILDCTNYGTVRGEIAGGILGSSNSYKFDEQSLLTVKSLTLESAAIWSIARCVNNGEVLGGACAGGIIGGNANMVVDCYNTGAVSGDGSASWDSDYVGVGGIAGQNVRLYEYAGIVENCYNIGTVKGKENTASVVGANDGKNYGYTVMGIVKNCYYLESTVADTNAEPKTADDFSSGEIAWLLQGGRDELVWGQTVNTENYPVLTDDTTQKVFQVQFEAEEDPDYTTKCNYMNAKPILPDPPSKSNYHFVGWETEDDQEFNTVTKDTVVHAVFEKDAVSGTVTMGGTSVADAKVSLKQGDKTMAATKTDNEGNYSFPNVEPGIYDVVVETEDKTMTSMVTVPENAGSGAALEKNMKLPEEDVSSVLDAKNAGDHVQAVGGLDKLAEGQTVAPGSSVTVTMSIEKTEKASAPNAAEIEKVAAGRELEFLEIHLEKLQNGEETGITEIKDPITIVLNFEFTDRTKVEVYRYHDGKVDVFNEKTAPAGESIAFDEDNKTITLQVNKFSTYAIGYYLEGHEHTTHTPSDWLKDDTTGQHYKICTVCKMELERGDHEKSWHVDEANGKHYLACDICGWEGVHEDHVGSWKPDQTGSQHIKTCTECGTVFDHAAHEATGWQVDEATGQHYQECKDCGAKFNLGDHSGTWEADKTGNQHIKTCTVCGTVLARAAHASDTWHIDEATGQHYKTCDDCGAEFGRATHASDTWHIDNANNQHYKTCDACEAEFARGEHNWTLQNTDEATGDKTYACECGATKTERGSEHSVSGKVVQKDGTPAAGAHVQLKQGDTVVAETTTDENGNYVFPDVEPDTYNLVVETEDSSTTILTTVGESTGSETTENVTMPAKGVKSKLEVKGEDTPKVVVGGLTEEAEAQQTDGGTVTLTLTVESKPENQATHGEDIRKEAGENTELTFLDIQVAKSENGGTAETMAETKTVLEIVIPYEIPNEENIVVYRSADGTVEILTTTPNADGEYIEVRDNAIVLHVKHSGTYAIGCRQAVEEPSYTITVQAGSYGTVTASATSAKEGETITITVTPADGYEVESVAVTDSTGNVVPAADNGDGTYTFEQPAGAVTVSATFGKITYAIANPSENISGRGSVVADRAEAAEGDTVTLTVTPERGYYLYSLKVLDQDGNPVALTRTGRNTCTFTQPAGGVTVKATFAVIHYGEPEPSVAPTATPTPSTTPVTPSIPATPSNPAPATYSITVPAATTGGSVTVDPERAAEGASVKLTVKAEDGYHLDALTVLDQDGKAVALKDNQDGTYTFTMHKGAIDVKATFVKCSTLIFPDLDPTAWYHEHTDYVISHGLMNGNEKGLFEPNGTVTRAQMVTLLWNLKGKPVVNFYMTYSDVSEEVWYAEAIRWATSEGIVSGCGDGSFGPADTITREQMAVMLYNYEQKYGDGGFTGTWMFRMPFSDLDQISEWAFEGVAWCYMRDVITGKDNDLMDPKGHATRAEMAAILTQYLKKDAEDEESPA